VLPQKPPPGSFWGRHKSVAGALMSADWLIRMVINLDRKLAVAAALCVLTKRWLDCRCR
jgi:hypothetical protein